MSGISAPTVPRGTPRALEVLLVEDNPGDVRLAQEAFKDLPIDAHLSVAEDGATAMDVLHHRGVHDHDPRPDLILLDLDMPGLDGREVLKRIKCDHGLECIPVVVLTASQSDEDMEGAYALHILSYLSKPVDLWQLSAVMQAVQDVLGEHSDGAEEKGRRGEEATG